MLRNFFRYLLPALLTLSSSAWAEDGSEFNTDFIHGAFDNRAVKQALAEGLNDSIIYDVQINGQPVGGYHFSRQQDALVFKEDFLQAISPLLTPSFLQTLKASMRLERKSPRYQVTEEMSASRLSVWFKDDDVAHQSDESVMPLTDTINALLMNYTASSSYFHNRQTGESQASLPFTSHIQLGLYDFPLNLDLSSSDVTREGVDVDNISVSHLLPSLKSEVVAGQTYTSTRYDEGFSFTGVQMNSVNDLFSRRERLYSPRITGYARSNATVEVYQDSRLLFTKAVAAGNFVIDEVQGVSNQTLRVLVKEADGSEHSFFYENTVVPGLLTPGTWNYQVNAGRYRYGDNHEGDSFTSFEYSYGLPWLTPTVSSVIANSYKNATIGTALPMRTLGALGISASASSFTLNDNTRTGQSYSINYAKYVDDAFNIQLAGYRYSTRDYYSFSDAMDEKRRNTGSHNGIQNRFTATLMTQEPLLGNQISFNLMRDSYWGRSDSQNTYSLYYGGMAWRANYNVSISRSYATHASSDTSVSLYIDIPFGSSGRSTYTRLSHDSNGNSTEAGINSYDGQSSWTASVARASANNENTLAGSYGTWNDRVSAQSNASIGSRSWYASGSLSGSMAFADSHLVLSNTQSTTMALVKLNESQETKVNGIQAQRNGYALLPLNQSFYEQDITVDVSSLKNNMMIANPQIRVRPRRGSVLKLDFTVQRVKYLRVVLLDNNHQPLGFGAHITSHSGESWYAGNGGSFLLQKVFSPEKTAQDMVLNSSDSGCIWRIAASKIAAGKDEDFINAGQIPCTKS